MPAVKPTRQQRRAAERKALKLFHKRIKAGKALPTLPPSDKKNIYDCGTHETVTVDRFIGTTPMMIKCPTCGRPATSRWYKVDQSLVATHEWTQPSPEEMKKMGREMTIHLLRGGLDLKKIATPEK